MNKQEKEVMLIVTNSIHENKKAVNFGRIYDVLASYFPNASYADLVDNTVNIYKNYVYAHLCKKVTGASFTPLPIEFERYYRNPDANWLEREATGELIANKKKMICYLMGLKTQQIQTLGELAKQYVLPEDPVFPSEFSKHNETCNLANYKRPYCGVIKKCNRF